MKSNSPSTHAILLMLSLAAGPALAENIDPDGKGSSFAWGENVGWLNAEPGGNGGPGLEVEDFRVTGSMWGENIGWVSFSCENTGTCGTTSYGVTNDGGVLGGWAWAENAGWISLSCANTSNCAAADYGVLIDPATGEFDGKAWSENLGWIMFGSDTAPYKMKTSWTCNVPAGVGGLQLAKNGQAAELAWPAVIGAIGYDVVRGDLGVLRASQGDFSAAMAECVADNELATTASHVGTPAPGGGWWFLVRAAACGGGSYDSGAPSQQGNRDAEIESAPTACP